jgi:4'-phosphopantetheinyl transferase
MTTVSALWIPDAAALAGDAADVLSPEESRRAASFRHQRDRRRYVVAHVWLRRLLGSRLGLPPASVRFEAGACAHCAGPHGKPQLPAATGLHFSLSHAGDVALCAVGGAPVGVDVEAVPAGAGYLELMSALEPRERRAVGALPAAERAAAFTQCWVRKEAYLKGTGEGLSREPDAVRVGVGTRYGDPGPDAGALGGWQLTDLDAPPGYAAAIAREVVAEA